MRRLRVLVVLVIVTATLALALPVGAATGVVAEAHRARTTTCSSAYFDGDSRLGPQQLPNAGPIAPIVRGYHRFAGLTEQEFLTTYWDPTANGGSGGWQYPPDNGFLLDPGGTPIEFSWSLQVGQEIDRFGSEFGAFLAPEDTPYAERALPPQSLDDVDPAFTCNYHLYRVVKPFTVEAGPIAPGFGQRGLGLQFQLVASLLPGTTATANVAWLLNNGYMQRMTPGQCGDYPDCRE